MSSAAHMLRALCALIALACCFSSSWAHSPNSHNKHHGHFHGGLLAPRQQNASMTLPEAQELVQLAHKAMAVANEKRLKSPANNSYQIYQGKDLEATKRSAPYLDYGVANSSVAQKFYRLRRRDLNTTATAHDGDSSSTLSYTIPPEVAEAAKMLAEANPPNLSTTKYEQIVEDLKKRANRQTNDTNVMPQVLRKPDGLHQLVLRKPDGLHQLVLTASHDADTETLHSNKKRIAASDFWMEKIVQRGVSPYAPSGYKVWRNVKDYGAKGDGTTDDTAAIQRAMSDGGRCGKDCTGSTTAPATVYFPSGNYLISSSIIQYFNTEMLGNPIDKPRLVASASFVGGGVIESNVYTGEQTEWYLNTNNFLRSIGNFVIDIRASSQTAQICGVHWQVAQGTSLENIDFYNPADVPTTTQQGIYKENGSGGFLTSLYFVGGKFGAYMGNQQYTATGLSFSHAETAIQIHWDWGWTMQSIVISQCTNGITIVGGAGGPLSTGQGVGSMVVTDMIAYQVKVAVKTSLHADNSTSFMLANSQFLNVDSIVYDDVKKTNLLAGLSGSLVNVESWGFGQVSNATGSVGFVNGAAIPAMVREPFLTAGRGSSKVFFTRHRPRYDDLGGSQLFDVKQQGAKGDGQTDDTVILNHILETAANLSAIVYFPYGIYMISDTLRVPLGSRIIGHSWPQLMAYGDKFADAIHPRVFVQVGNPGDVGALEIQNMMFTVRGATAGAVLMEWNVHESSQGSAGLWYSHFRVGGAKGSNLDTTTCPKGSGTIKSGCIAASLMMHITKKASAYLENVWIWTADHLIDDKDQTQIDVYSARGLLIESEGPTWLWGTAVEHSVLYQYQIASAKNLVLGLIQTESPYFQAIPAAPKPFRPGSFPNDPTFGDCSASDTRCGLSWAVRILDSTSIYVLSASLYSWFQAYSQDCINSKRFDCQQRLFQVEASSDIWIYNLVTVRAVEMISPVNGKATIAADNRNGFAASIMAWLGGSVAHTGTRKFEGYQLYALDNLQYTKFPAACKTTLVAKIECDGVTSGWTSASYHGDLGNTTLTESVCDGGCAKSISNWISNVETYCQGFKFETGYPPAMFGNYIQYGINETCQTLLGSTLRCNTLINLSARSDGVANIPTSLLCLSCYTDRLKMMQASKYSAYWVSTFFQDVVKRMNQECGKAIPTEVQGPLVSPTPTPTICVSDKYHTVESGDTCDTIALANSVSSADLFMNNKKIIDCDRLTVGDILCLPLECQTLLVEETDTCLTLSLKAGIDDVRLFNKWINYPCDNLHVPLLGNVLCASPAGGVSETEPANDGSSNTPGNSTGYGTDIVAPPADTTVADQTTTYCGAWYVVKDGDSCAATLLRSKIDMDLFTLVNPSVKTDSCDSDLQVGVAYCVAPLRSWFLNYENGGCYSNAGSDVLREKRWSPGGIMTVRRCAEYCVTENNYHMFGIASGYACLCDTALTRHSVKVDDF